MGSVDHLDDFSSFGLVLFVCISRGHSSSQVPLAAELGWQVQGFTHISVEVGPPHGLSLWLPQAFLQHGGDRVLEFLLR